MKSRGNLSSDNWATLQRQLLCLAFIGLLAAPATAQLGHQSQNEWGTDEWRQAAKLGPRDAQLLADQIASSPQPTTLALGEKSALAGPVIDVWYGPLQTFGQLGTPQNWVNILGNVSGTETITGLEYSLNSSPPVTLSIGPDDRRLADPGDFNIDLAVTDLLNGLNQVVITATDSLNVQAVDTVMVDYNNQTTWPLPYNVNWSTVTNPQDAVQIVDGRWEILNGGLRTTQIDYDRVIDFGDLAWDNYEVTTTVTLHGTEQPGPLSGSSGGVGFVTRWLGHSDYPAEAGGLQPKSGWLPSGGASYYSISPAGITVDGLFDPTVSIGLGETVNWKFRVESPPGLGGRYSVKIWPLGQSEPAAWNLVRQRGTTDETNGSLVFYAHHTDVTLGDVQIVEIPNAIGNVQVLNTASDSAVISWSTTNPSTSSVDYGLNTAYGSNQTSPALVTEHSITLTGLAPNTTYHFQASATDAGSYQAVDIDRTFNTTPATLVSDDFNSCTLDMGVWSAINPLGDASIHGDGTRAVISLPASASTGHSAWGTGPSDFVNNLPRLMQPVADTDMQFEVRFETGVSVNLQSQGVMIEQDANDMMYVEFLRDYNGDTRIRALKIENGAGSNFGEWGVPIGASGVEPLYLRVNRTADTWTIFYSFDGLTWQLYNVVEHALNVSAVGFYAGNGGAPAPAMTANVDYFFNSAAPISPEDPIVRSAPVLASIGDYAIQPATSLSIDLSATDADLDPITLGVSGLPSFASFTDFGDGTGNITLNPGALDIGDFDLTVTATDSPCGLFSSETFTVHIGTVAVSDYVSDDFNACELDTTVWNFVNPAGDATVRVNGTQAEISVPANTTHDIWGSSPTNFADTMPRLMQTTVDADFTLETRLESSLNTTWQGQGFIIEQDANDLLRIEFGVDSSAQVTIAVYKIIDGTGSNVGGWGTPIAAAGAAPLGLKVERSGDLWNVSYSLDDGATWVLYQSFLHAMTVSAAGIHCGNGGSPAPAHTVLVDYVFNMASPIVPEDPIVRSAPLLTTIGNQTLAEGASLTIPVSATDADLDPITLTAAGLPGFAVLNDFGNGSGELVLTPQPGDAGSYPVSIIATDAPCGLTDLESLTIQVDGLPGPTIISDDFNGCELDTLTWSFFNPTGDATVRTNGTQLEISVPANAGHDVWGSGPGDFVDTMPRLMQATGDTDLALEVRFESSLVTPWQGQGLIIEQDNDDLLRIELGVNNSAEVTLAALKIVGGAGGNFGGWGTAIAPAGSQPLGLRVERTGDSWTVSYSLDDGLNWVVYQTFTHVMTVSAVGLHCGNGGLPVPAHTMIADYLFDMASPVVPEDPIARSAPVLASIGNQSVVEGATVTVPINATDAETDPITITAAGLPPFAALTPLGNGAAEISLNPQPGDAGDYVVTVTATDAPCGLHDSETLTIHVGTTVIANISSDDFNDCALDTGLWNFVNPSGDATVSVNGSQVLLSVPAGTFHDLWGTNATNFSDTMPRLMQPVTNGDFEIEARFESVFQSNWQGQGFIVEQDLNDMLRFEFGTDGAGQITIAAFKIVDGAGANIGGWGTAIAPVSTSPLRLKLLRTVDLWTISYSVDDGATWVVYQTFSHPMTVAAVGVHCGNGGPSQPANTVILDYFFNNASPVVPEDPTPFNAPVLAAIGDQSILVESSLTVPVSATDADLEPLTLAATGLPSFASFVDFTDGTGELVFNPLAADLGNYPITITASDPCGLTASETFNVNVDTLFVSSLVSDDFNCNYLDTGLWTFVNPLADATMSLNGTQAVVSLPGGTVHDAWGTGPGDFSDSLVRLTQPVNDEDFAVEARFESGLTTPWQAQGIVVGQDADDLLRAEFLLTDTGQVRIAIFDITAGAGTNIGGWGTEIASIGTAPMGLRVDRQGNQWSVAYTTDDSTWTVYQSFTHNLIPAEVGVHFGNGGTPVPPLTGIVDYFFNQATPIIPEDGNTLSSPVLAAIADLSVTESQVASIPITATDPEGDPIVLTALGLPGFAVLFDNGDGTGTIGLSPQIGDAGVYPIQIVAADECAAPDTTAFTLTVQALVIGSVVSDDFNSCTLNGGLWSWSPGHDDARHLLSGTQLLMSVSADSTHEISGTGALDFANSTARVTQPISDTDMSVEVSFESAISALGQSQGALFAEDVDDLLAVDFVGLSSGQTSLRLRRFTAGAGADLGSIVVGAMGQSPLAVRVTRTGNDWAIAYSTDSGASWPAFTTVTEVLGVTATGVYAGNTGAPAPAHHAIVDYFFNTTLPIVPEDGLPCAVPAAITDLTVSAATTGYDADGTTRIQLGWSPASCGATVDIYRKGYGSYPDYSAGATPAVPTDPTQALANGWQLAASVPATLTQYDDEPAARDYWYYLAVVRSGCGDDSAMSNLPEGALNYRLGDVTDGATPGAGDNGVMPDDVTLLATAYGLAGLDVGYLPYLDVGPTVTGGADSRPVPDSLLDFEDLMVFAQSYDGTGPGAPAQTLPPANELSLHATGVYPAIGQTYTVEIVMRGAGDLRGVSIPLAWDNQVLAFSSLQTGPLLGAQDGEGIVLSPAPGLVDAAVMGQNITGISGEGVLASITFTVVGTGSPAVALGAVSGRDLNNTNQAVLVLDVSDVPDGAGLPALTTLYQNAPNPFNPMTMIAFDVAQSGRVRLRVFGLNGGLVKTIIDEDLTPGRYERMWNGKDQSGRQVASGAYIFRLDSATETQTRRMMLIK